MNETELTQHSNLRQNSIIPTPASKPRMLAILVLSVGGIIVAASLCGVVVYGYQAVRGLRAGLETNTLIASILAIGLIFGGLALVVGVAALSGRSLPRFTLPSPWLFVGLFMVVIILGQAVLTAN